jgi:hypothetical protein
MSVDFGSLEWENTDVAYLGSGSLNYPSEAWLLVSDDAHIIPKRTAKQRYPLLWIELELSLLRMIES